MEKWVFTIKTMLTLHIVYDDVGSSQPNAIQQNGECECHLAEKIFTARNSSKEVVIYITIFWHFI